MAKLTLNDITGQYASTTELNANFALIETALENTVSRDGTTPNTMSSDLDLNSNNLLNINTVNATAVQINGVSVVPGDTLTVPTAASVPNVPSGNIAATDVQSALNELDTEKVHATTLASTANGDGASTVGIEDAGAYFTGTDVETALQEIGATLGGGDTGYTTNTNLTPYINLKIRADNGTATDQIDVTADGLKSYTSGGAEATHTSVSFTIDLATTGVANGLDTGSATAQTMYHLWVIYNGTTVAGLASLSDSAPAMPSGYTYKGYIGVVYTGVAATLLDKSVQINNKGYGYGLPLYTGISSTPTLVSLTNKIPTKAKFFEVRNSMNNATTSVTNTTTIAEYDGTTGHAQRTHVDYFASGSSASAYLTVARFYTQIQVETGSANTTAGGAVSGLEF